MTHTGFNTPALRHLGLAACALLNLSGTAVAADAIPAQTGSALHAATLFALVWLIASLRIGRLDGRWRLGFDLVPVRRRPEVSAAPASHS